MALLGLITALGDPRLLAMRPVSDGFTNFETEPVRPLAMSSDASLLFALNTADDRLEVFDVTSGGDPRLVGEVAVGLRPVALAVVSPTEIWVANHLSDSVSVVDVTEPTAPRVARTLQVGDEPRDIVVAGPAHNLVFVATARRTANTTTGVGRADVWVFDAGNASLDPLKVVTLYGLKPRALAASADGRTVYAAVFRSGNRTTTVHESVVAEREAPTPTPTFPSGVTPDSTPTSTPTGPNPTPTAQATFFHPPAVSVIAQRVGGLWVDDRGRDWTAQIPFDLVDYDVFAIDAASADQTVKTAVSGVGTVLFNMAVRPGTGEVWVTNTEARNLERFEPTVRCRAVESRVSRLVPGTGPGEFSVVPVPLNPQIVADAPPGSAAEIALGVSQPTDIVFTADGARAYVAAFGSRMVAVLDGEGAVVDRIPVGFGPGGLALDELGGRLFVLNHLEATLSTVVLADSTVTTVPLAYDPTPPLVHAGRPLLYDAALSSGHGDQSCASCHVFGDMDGLAWDLGDPDGEVVRMPFDLTHDDFVLKPRDFRYHPEKGPMMTQSLRGLKGTGPFHWRGDRFGPEDDPAEDIASFMQFKPAFESLLGRGAPITDEQMDAFARFAMTIHYPPNPIQAVDGNLTPAQAAGAEFFSGSFRSDSGVTNCAGCHTLPTGTNRQINFEGDRSGQDFKAPQLRNLYEKVGRFDVRLTQVSGYGFGHDGSTDVLMTLLRSDLFVFPGDTDAEHDAIRADLAEYLLAFDTGIAPAVGRQLTLHGAASAPDRGLLDTLISQAGLGECDLVARQRLGSEERGWLLAGARFVTDRQSAAPETAESLMARAGEAPNELTFTCVPPGDGHRSALDRDQDGHRNGDELDAGTDPSDPDSHPGGPPSPTPRPVAGKAYFPSARK